MTKLIFHVGMGKTGTSSIQASLNASDAALREHGICYLGMWQEMISEKFRDQPGVGRFRDFLTLPEEEMIGAAEKLSSILQQKSKEENIDTFIFSNEQYFGAVEYLIPFFRKLEENFELQVLIWARPVDEWLPSACAQWGILHKTNKGPVEPFTDQADRLIRQYNALPMWKEAFEDAAIVRPFRRGTDPVQDFGSILGVSLSTELGPRQVRPDTVELLLRAAFNTQHSKPVLPHVFNNTMGRQERLSDAKGVSGKVDLLLGRDAMPVIIERHKAMLAAASQAAGFDLSGTGITARDLPEQHVLVDELLGRLLEIVAGQSCELLTLKQRIKSLEDGLDIQASSNQA